MNILKDAIHTHAKWILGVSLVCGTALPVVAQNQTDPNSANAHQPSLSGASISASEFSAKNSLQKSPKGSLPNRLFIKQPAFASSGTPSTPSLRIAPPSANPVTPDQVRWFPAPNIPNQRDVKPIPTANRRFLQETPATESAPGNDDFYGVLAPTTVPDTNKPVVEPSEPPELTQPQTTPSTSPSDLLIAPVPGAQSPEAVKPEEANEDRREGRREELLGEFPQERSENDLLLEDREKSVTPFSMPNLRTPVERVVPVPVQPASENFPGFEPKTTDELELPEPRRIFPSPKVERIPPPPLANSQGNQALPGTSSMNGAMVPLALNQGFANQGGVEFQDDSYPMILNGGTYSNSPRFGSILNDSTPTSRQMTSGPVHGFLGRRLDPTARHAAMVPHQDSWQSQLDENRWQLHQNQPIADCVPEGPRMANGSCQVPFQEMDFAPIPFEAKPLDPQLELQTYTGKLAVETQRPWVEWWRPFYTGGMYEPGVPVFSDVNLLQPSFLVYGDYRTAVGIHRDQGQHIRNWAHRLNLDMDLRLTGTERFHLFTGPLDHNGRFTRLDFSDNDVEFEEELDFQADTAFFEGDLGAITGSLIGDDAPFDLPFTCGLVPLLYQNGIWMEDAIAGFALGTPWKHNRELNISNFEATFFAGFNQVTSPAFQNDNNDAGVYGTAWFLEAYQGYIEADYAYLDDFDNLGRSYHNAAIAYTRRYFGRISNSIRLIGNVGQSGPANTRTADGGLLLFENSLISSKPSNVVPYWNFFVGSGRPQSVARAGNAGGILRNTGINFETDALTGYPTLNATGANAYGGAIGVNVLSADFRQQWIGEFAALDTYGDPLLKAVAGPQYALGTRYQRAINNRSIWRIDFMNGWIDRGSDIYGMRTEFRWKF
jgi:hypothetical protein